MEDYKDLIYKESEERKGFDISCSAPPHKEILLENIINNAKKSISFFVGYYDKDFCDNDFMLKLFSDFIERTNGEGIVRMIVSGKNVNEISYKEGLIKKLNSCYENYQKENHLRMYKFINNEKTSVGNDFFNFVFVDGDFPYIFEVVPKHNPLNKTAHANFSDKKASEQLKDIFYKNISSNAIKINVN